MQKILICVVLLLWCGSPVYAEESAPIPHPLNITTHADGTVTLTAEQLQYIILVLNQQLRAITESQSQVVRIHEMYKDLEKCVRTAVTRNTEVARCLDSDVRLWSAGVDK